LALVGQRPAVQESAVCPPVWKSLVRGKLESGCSMLLGGRPLAAELMEYGSFAQSETQAQRVCDLVRQGHGCLAPGQRLVRIAQIPQRPGGTAETYHANVLHEEGRSRTMVGGVVQSERLRKMGVRCGDRSPHKQCVP